MIHLLISYFKTKDDVRNKEYDNAIASLHGVIAYVQKLKSEAETAQQAIQPQQPPIA